MGEAKRVYDQAVVVQEKLRAYLAAFGEGRLDALKTRQFHVREQTEGLQAELQSVSRQMETLSVQQIELAAQVRSTEDRCRALSEQRKSVVSYLEAYGNAVNEWRQQMEASARALADLAAQRELVEAKSDEFEHSRQAYWNEEQELKRKIEAHETIIKSLVASDPVIDSQVELDSNPRTFLALEAEYTDALAAVQSAELQTTVPLTMQRDSRRREVERLEREYGKKFPPSRCAIADVEALLGTGIDERLDDILNKLVQAKDGERAAAMTLRASGPSTQRSGGTDGTKTLCLRRAPNCLKTAS